MKFEQIRDVVVKTKQADPAKLGRDKFVYIDIASIDRRSKQIVEPQTISVEDAPSRARKSVQTDDVLVSTVRPNLNSIARVPSYLNREIASTGFCVLRAKPIALDSTYLFYFVQTQDFVRRMTRLSIGAGYPAVTDDNILDTEILLPPLPEQKRMAAILARADRLRRLRRYALELSGSYLQSVFLEMFGDPASNPKGWPLAEVERILSKKRTGLRTGPFGSSLKKHEYVESGVPVWGIQNLRENEFVEAGSLFVTPEKYKQLTNYEVEAGDILMSRAGTVGRLCVAQPKQSPSIIGTNLVRVALDDSEMVPEYFTALFTYFGTRVGRLKMTADENAYSFLNPSILRTLLLPVPPLPLQEKFAQIVHCFERLRVQQLEAARQAEQLFQALLQQAFSGELSESNEDKVLAHG